MKEIVFATGNSRKIKEANATLAPYGITVRPVRVTTDEIQHVDPAEITKAKAQAAYDQVGKPVVVSDTSWSIPALGGFPGGYMKDIASWWSVDDWVAVMKPHADRRIHCLEHVAYYDGVAVQHFVQEYEGQLVDVARGAVQDSESFEALTVLYGGKTMAEQLEAGDIASAGEELEHWKQFGKWYSERLS